MTRERFERPVDLDNETDVAEGVERLMNWRLHRLALSNAHYNLDFFATTRGSRTGAAWVEVKTRRHDFGTFPTIILSAGKWREGISFAQTTGLDFLLFFAFKDGVYRFRYPGAQAPADSPHPTDYGPLGRVGIEWGGRTTDMRDDADAEPVMHLPVALWTKVELPPAPERHPF